MFKTHQESDGIYLGRDRGSFQLGPFETEEQAIEFSKHLADLDTDRLYYCEGDHDWDNVTTDPYGSIAWSIGNSDDFVCFDWASHGNFVVIHSTVNSETGGFIEDFDYRLCHYSQALQVVDEMIESARDWANQNDVMNDPNLTDPDPDFEFSDNLDELKKDIHDHFFSGIVAAIVYT